MSKCKLYSLPEYLMLSPRKQRSLNLKQRTHLRADQEKWVLVRRCLSKPNPMTAK